MTSEYPWVNKYGEYPVGHPTIYLEPENQDPNAYYGLMKIDILPPIHLFYPVLPYRQKIGPSSKLTFPLCRSCVEQKSIKPIEDRNYICIHSDEERMLRGTCVLQKYIKPLQRGIVSSKSTRYGISKKDVAVSLLPMSTPGSKSSTKAAGTHLGARRKLKKPATFASIRSARE